MTTALMEFYRSVRDDAALMARVAETDSADALIGLATAEARARGVTLSPDEIRAALADPEGFFAVAVGDELSDSELELVAAGAAPSKCTSGGSGLG